jgi:hypothetical protein
LGVAKNRNSADIEDMGKISFGCLFALLVLGGLWADIPSGRTEDDSALRISLSDSWFRGMPGGVISRRPENYILRGGSRIQVRVETSSKNRDEFAIVLAREQDGRYLSYSQGSWALIRSRDNDIKKFRIQVFLRSDYNTYVQFRYFTEDKCYMDVIIYDAYIIRSLPLPVTFERLYAMPVEDVLALAGDRFPRRYVDPEPDRYRDTRAFITSVRALLPGLSFLDDGAINENGDYVFINTLEAQTGRGGLNCSGFAKWVIDGMLRPLTGNRLPIAPLKAPFGSRGSPSLESWEELRDPFFGLDWCRNLASQAGTILRSPSFSALEEIEVSHWPFSQVILKQDEGNSNQSYPGYIRNAGFGFEGLQPLLYSLTVDEPGRIYLAAVNNELGAPVTPDNPRGLPRMRQYYHIAVLVPYFNERGTFQVVVFESAEETSFTRFRTRYPGQFVNLSRVPIDGKFDP